MHRLRSDGFTRQMRLECLTTRSPLIGLARSRSGLPSPSVKAMTAGKLEDSHSDDRQAHPTPGLT